MKIVKKIQNVFFHIKIQKQLYFIYLFAILLSILATSSYLITNTYHLMLKHYNEQTQADNLRVKSILYDVTTSVYNISDDLFRDSELQSLLATRYTTENAMTFSTESYDTISEYMKSETSITSIQIYTSNQTLGNTEYMKQIDTDVIQSDWYQKAIKQPTALWYSGSFIDSWKHSYPVLQLIRRLPILSNNTYAVMVITINNNYLKNRIQAGDFKTLLSVNQEPIFYSTDSSYLKKSLFFKTKPSESFANRINDNLLYHGKKSISCLSTYSPIIGNDSIYIATIDTNGWNDIYHFTSICILIVIAAALIPCLLVVYFTGIFNTRITTLRHEMHKVSLGDYDIIDHFIGDDELASLFQDLKTMITSIKTMDAKLYESTLHKQKFIAQQEKMKFAILASQINPHFLYNTLESIRMKSLMEGNKEVADAIMMLGKSMRYVLENNQSDSTTLQKELDYIILYLSIQKIRFGDRVNYDIFVDSSIDTNEFKILPLLIQPVVENALLHGLKKMDKQGHIHIRILKRITTIAIQIEDDGCGISTERILELKESMKDETKTDGHSIGLRNIYQRIQLYYGTDYEIEIESKEGVGTSITLILPSEPLKEGPNV